MRWTALTLQIVLSLFFLFSSTLKLTGGVEEMREHLGIAPWFWGITAMVETIGAVALLAGLAAPRLAVYGALWLAATLAGGVVSHLRVSDPPTEMIPAISLLLLASIVVALRWRTAGPGRLRSSAQVETSRRRAVSH